MAAPAADSGDREPVGELQVARVDDPAIPVVAQRQRQRVGVAEMDRRRPAAPGKQRVDCRSRADCGDVDSAAAEGRQRRNSVNGVDIAAPTGRSTP
jgi:hypothetical protein